MKLGVAATASCQHVFQPATKQDRQSVPTPVGQFACTTRTRPLRKILSTKHGWLNGVMAHTGSQPEKPAANVAPLDAVEGGLSQYLGNLCFRSKYSTYLWNTSISAPYRVIRIAAMTVISLLLLARSWRLFIRSDAALQGRPELHAEHSKQSDWLLCLMNDLNTLRECFLQVVIRRSNSVCCLCACQLAIWHLHSNSPCGLCTHPYTGQTASLYARNQCWP